MKLSGLWWPFWLRPHCAGNEPRPARTRRLVPRGTCRMSMKLSGKGPSAFAGGVTTTRDVPMVMADNATRTGFRMCFRLHLGSRENRVVHQVGALKDRHVLHDERVGR